MITQVDSFFRRPPGYYSEEHSEPEHVQERPPGAEGLESAQWKNSPEEPPTRPTWAYGPFEEENVWNK